ncbi:hypothetical protein ACLMJK_000151 [Lecanora helva]
MLRVNSDRYATDLAAEQRNVRIEDFLNDKLQNSSDLADIDALLDSVRHQQGLLKQQVETLLEARRDLDKSTEAASAQSEDLLHRCKKFRSQQSDIDRRLLIVTRSETSDDAVKKFDASMQSLRKLDVAQGYMQLLSEVEDLGSQARRNFNSSPKAALDPYLRMQSLVDALRKAQPAAEDAAPHLVDHVDSTTRALWKQMKDTFGNDFERTLKKIKWPAKDITLDGSLEQEWTDGVKKLLELQEPELRARDNEDITAAQQEESLVLLPLEIMVKPLELRFTYHFEGDRPTNRLDKNIIDAPDNAEIDYDSVDQNATKPIFAAVRVNDLLETITDRYRPLTSFSQKLRFLIDIQITIFDQFHSRLNDSLDAYLTSTSSIARTVQGTSRESQANLQGLGGLERLCRVYGSAEYLEKKMRDWSDDIFFVELWDELQDRARSNGGRKNLAGPMSVDAVAERTSSTVGSDEDSGALFDETAGAYKRLRIRSEGFMQEMLIHSLRETLRPYGRINPWSSLSSESSTSLALTAELDATVQQLNEYLSFLVKVLAQAPLRRIFRQLALAMQTFFWDHVLLRYTFSAGGVAQFSRDMEAIWVTIDHWLGEAQGEIGMRKLKEGLTLLSLPVKKEQVEDLETEDISLDLWEVEKRVFRNNESARAVLDELGLESLSETDARHILERRIELGS